MAGSELGEVVIVGAGIIGCSIAYHLAELNVKSTIIERCNVACAASGKAGGFLARSVRERGKSVNRVANELRIPSSCSLLF